MCGKGSQKTQTTTPPAYIASAQQGVINQAQNVAAAPFQPYTGQLTAGLTPTQTNAAASLANVGPISSADIDRYMSPYLNDVVNATQANINESNAEQQQSLRGNAISAGAWGGDRAGVAAAELARQQNLAGQQTIAGLRQAGYNTALSTAQQQQQDAEQRALAQYGIGTQEQQTNQNALTAAYQQYLLKQQYPFATTQFLSGIVGQQAPAAGGTTTDHTSGNLFSDILGGVTTAAGLFGFNRGGTVPHMADGGSNVLSMADALRRLPPQTLAALHARMGQNPMLRNAMATRPGFADGGMPYELTAPDVTTPTAPSIASIVPEINLPAPVAPAPASLATIAPASGAASSSAAGDAGAPSGDWLGSLKGNGEVSSYLDKESRNPLLAFGLGTLAGSNDPGASAIGRGGLAALQGVETRRKADLDLALEREQLRGAGTENSLKDLQLKAYQDLAGITGAPDVTGHVNSLMTEADGAAPPSTTAPATAAADTVAPSARPASASSAPAGGVAPLFNTASLMHQYQIAARTPGMEGLATQLLGVINKGVPEGSYLGQDGGVYTRPGYLEGVEAKAAAEAAAREANTPHFTASHDAFGNPISFDTRSGQATPIAGASGGQDGQPLSLADYTAKVTGSESGGNPNARNPNSTATGLGQFTAPTWLTIMKAERPDLTNGKSDAAILAMRTDPTLSSEMTQAYARQNADRLTAANLPVTSASLYLAHGFGADGAIKIMQSPENAPLTSILPKNVFDANPQLRGMTAGDVARNFAGKVGTDPVNVGNGSTAGVLAPHDNTPATVETTAKAIANYQLPPLTGFAMRSPWGQSVMAKVTDINPDYSAGEFATRNKARSAFATGPQGNGIRFINNALGHLNLAKQLVAALQNGDIPAINRLSNDFKEAFGVPAPTNFDAAKDIFANEVVKSIVGSGGGVTDRKGAQDQVSRAGSPSQLLGVIGTWEGLMGRQLEGYHRQYDTSVKGKEWDSFLSPEARSLQGIHKGDERNGYVFQGGDPSKPASWKKKAA